MRLALAAQIAASLFAMSCASPLEAPSAYAGEHFLCDAEHAVEWEAFVSACNEQHRSDGSCPGVTSVRGQLDGESFVADSRMLWASYQYDEAKPTSLGYTAFDAESPYFKFGYSSDTVTTVTAPGGSAACNGPGINLFGMEVRGSSDLQRMKFDRCTMANSASGLHYGFSAHFASGEGFVEGCAQFPPEPPHP